MYEQLPDDTLTNDLLHRCDVSSVPLEQLLTNREDEARLIEQARQGDTKAREQLIYSCLYYVHKVAAKYTRLCRANGKWRIEYLDLVQVGSEELLMKLDAALASHNPCGYLRKAASGAIIDYCDVYEDLLTPYACNGHYTHVYQTESLDQPVYQDRTDEDRLLREIIPEPEPTGISSRDFTPLLQAIENLAEKQRELITCHYGIDCAPETIVSIVKRQRQREGRSISTHSGGWNTNYYAALKKLHKLLAPVYLSQNSAEISAASGQ